MMNTNLKPDRSGKASYAFATSLNGEVSRKAGNIRAVTLDGKTLSTEYYFRAAKAVQESLDETFGDTLHNTRLETDRKAYELKAGMRGNE